MLRAIPELDRFPIYIRATGSDTLGAIWRIVDDIRAVADISLPIALTTKDRAVYTASPFSF